MLWSDDQNKFVNAGEPQTRLDDPCLQGLTIEPGEVISRINKARGKGGRLDLTGIDDGGGGAEAKAEADAAEAEAEAARLAERSSAAEVARVAASAAAEPSRRREAEETARANREWIMRRYDDDDDGRGTDDDWDASSSASDDDGSSHDSLEDFGLEPEEIERRAFVRRRRRAYDADPAAHLRRMKAERDEARRKASVAKASR